MAGTYAKYSGAGGGGGSSGIISINGDTTAAQVIASGTGISVATSGGTTTITNTEPFVGSFANQQLSNLSGTVAINLSLLPGVTNSVSLGNSTHTFSTLSLGTNATVPLIYGSSSALPSDWAYSATNGLLLESTSNTTTDRQGYVQVLGNSAFFLGSSAAAIAANTAAGRNPNLSVLSQAMDTGSSLGSIFQGNVHSVDVYGAGPIQTFSSTSYPLTGGTPGYWTSGNDIYTLNVNEYNGSGPEDANVASIVVSTTENHSVSALGNQMVLSTTPNGTTTPVASLTLQGNNVGIVGPLQQVQQTTPGTNPPSGSNDLYFKSDNNLYSLSSSGTETKINGTGTVTAVSVASANGFAGTSSGGATPALTLSTTVTGILYGNGTSVAAAVAGNFPTLNQNTSGTAANITATSNSTLTTLSSLSLPGSQVSGNISGNAANITGTLSLSNLTTGSNNQYLRMGSSTPAWQTGNQIIGVTSKTGTYSIGATDDLILCNAGSGGFTVTLPSAATSGQTGKVYQIKKTDSSFNVVTVATTSSQTIDGVVGTTLNTQNECITVISDGSNWQMQDRKIPSQWSTSASATSLVNWTNQTSTYYWRRVGDSAEIEVWVQLSGAGSSTFSFTLPNSWAINQNAFPSGGTPYPSFQSHGTGVHSGSSYGPLLAVPQSTAGNNVVNLLYTASSSTMAYLTASAPVTFANTDYIFFGFKVPINGWNG